MDGSASQLIRNPHIHAWIDTCCDASSLYTNDLSKGRPRHPKFRSYGINIRKHKIGGYTTPFRNQFSIVGKKILHPYSTLCPGTQIPAMIPQFVIEKFSHLYIGPAINGCSSNPTCELKPSCAKKFPLGGTIKNPSAIGIRLISPPWSPAINIPVSPWTYTLHCGN